jgi:hypothetical protein
VKLSGEVVNVVCGAEALKLSGDVVNAVCGAEALKLSGDVVNVVCGAEADVAANVGDVGGRAMPTAHATKVAQVMKRHVNSRLMLWQDNRGAHFIRGSVYGVVRIIALLKQGVYVKDAFDRLTGLETRRHWDADVG